MEAQALPDPPGWLDGRLPQFMTELHLWGMPLWQWFGLVAALLVALPLGYLAARVLLGIAARLVQRTQVTWDDALVAVLAAPTRAFWMLITFHALVGLLALRPPHDAAVRQVLSQAWILVMGVFLFRLLGFGSGLVESIMLRKSTDEAQKRGIQTMVVLLRRLATVVLLTLVIALMLTRFEVVRTVGMSLLASAGVAGIVIGLAAQRSISTLLAGIQLAITQPLRVGDTVIFSGEYGTVEEIELTFVVLRLWDQRRLVVPIGKFLDDAFQNWTRSSSELLGTVEIPADHRLPVDAVREELTRLCEGSPFWDKRVCKVHITNVTERTITVRALVSAANAGDLFELRAFVREKLVGFLQATDGGKYLPRVRFDT